MVGHVRKMRLVGADVGHLMRDDQMRPSQSRARWSPSSGKSGIGEGDLLIGRGQHHFLNRLEALHFLFELDQLLLERRGPGHKLLRGRLTGGLSGDRRCRAGSDSAQRSPRSAPAAAPSFPS